MQLLNPQTAIPVRAPQGPRPVTAPSRVVTELLACSMRLWLPPCTAQPPCLPRVQVQLITVQRGAMGGLLGTSLGAAPRIPPIMRAAS